LLAAVIAGAAPAAASAAPTVTLAADQTSVKNGTTVNFTVTVTKDSAADHSAINNLIDNLDGPIDGKGSCVTAPAGPDLTVLKPTFSCTYPFVVDGRGGTKQTHTLTAVGVDTLCSPPPETPGSACPGIVTDVGFSSLSNEATVTLKCKKGQKLRKGRCRRKR
jgi:hypothetical protein